MPVHIVNHPLVRHKLGLMRKHNISTKDFRELASELARILTWVVFAIGGMDFSAGDFTIKGIGLVGISGVALNLLLPGRAERG
ncbi:MAG: uracil phosphoribosyltransferase [Desulfosoma sp.]